jgi:hypothetical protein
MLHLPVHTHTHTLSVIVKDISLPGGHFVYSLVLWEKNIKSSMFMGFNVWKRDVV